MTDAHEIVTMSVKDVKPYARNPRRNDGAVDAVAESIREFGFRNPIIVDADHVIIAGHTRLKAAKKLKLKQVPVIVADDLTEEQVRALRLADNKTSELSEWDGEALEMELADIMDIDMELFGFEESFIDVSPDEVIEDEPPEPPEEPVTRLGDLYRLGDHVLLCGDSTDQAQVTRLMEGTRAQMMFTDPPWNVDYGGSDHPTWKNRRIMNDNMTTEEFHSFLSRFAACAKKSLVGGGLAYIVMSAQEWGTMMLALDEGFHWSSTIVWAKNQAVLSRKDYHTQYEPIWYGWEDSGPRVHPLKDRKQSDLWPFDRPKVSDEHPTMKPVALVARAVVNSSDPGDTVLDLFGGSGTTMVACEQTGRRCRMMELDPKYCDVIVQRWETLTGDVAVLEREAEE